MKKLRVTLIAVAVLALLGNAAFAQPSGGVMFVKNNKVGIGVSDPLYDLHVVNTATASGNDVVGQFENNGAPLVRFTDTAIGVSWILSPLSSGDFSITKTGTGGAEFLVRQSGQVRMGPGPITTFDLDPAGNLTILGSLTQGSSRATKEGFATLDGREVLSRVADLELLEWSYKNQSARHFGPMAEDFHATFGLGASETGLAPGDVAGVALKALQGLHEMVADKDQEIDRLSRELAELRALVEGLTSR